MQTDTDVTLTTVEAQGLIMVNQTQTFLLASLFSRLAETHSRHAMAWQQHVMVTSTGPAHAQMALLARMRSVLLVSVVTHVTENRGRVFVCTGLVVQVKIGL